MRFAHDFEIAAKPHRNSSLLTSHSSLMVIRPEEPALNKYILY